MTAPGAGTPAATGNDGPDHRCPDCGRASCTGEGCYWPDEAGIARPEPAATAPGVTVDPDDLLTAAERARDEYRDERDSLTGRVDGLVGEVGELRRKLIAVTADRDAWCERAGELLTEAGKD